MLAKKQRVRAISITMLNPKEIANTVAKTVLITEAQPFIPQAQGIRGEAVIETSFNPEGKGIPIKKARGAIREREKNIFIPSEN